MNRQIIREGKEEFDFELDHSCPELDINETIKKLQQLKKNGVDLIELSAYADHEGNVEAYDLECFSTRYETDEEFNKRIEREKKAKEEKDKREKRNKEARIKRYEWEIERLKKELGK